MSATADWYLEVNEARDYFKRQPQITKAKTDKNGVQVISKNGTKYNVNPIPRDDYPKSRKMKGWKVLCCEEQIGEMVSSYEQAAKLVTQDIVSRCDHKRTMDGGCPKCGDPSF